MKMKKKMMFLFLLFPMLFGTADLYAQVTIGSDNAPHSGAILDLQSTEKGLKLPAVSLEDVAKFQLSADEDDAVGMMVYNTNNEIAGGNGTGIYTWSGRWIFAGRNAPVEVPVSRIVITSPGNVTMVRAGDTLRLTARVLPDTASNQKLAWSVPWNSSLTAGKAVVNDTGLVVGVKPGSVTVRAAAIDGSGVSRDFALAVLPTGTATGISISSETGEYSVEVARTLQLIAAITPETAYPTAKWEITVGAENASVSANGVVTGKAIGAARVKATTMDSTSPLADSVDIAVTSIALPPDTLRI
ncbi:MAG: Ig-like domain-containing protein, partial [Dysgonamonadaceae bacterium]|nr:Ig-like domain-containing protein [Dysgonamonadaceae bacterium]